MSTDLKGAKNCRNCYWGLMMVLITLFVLWMFLPENDISWWFWRIFICLALTFSLIYCLVLFCFIHCCSSESQRHSGEIVYHVNKNVFVVHLDDPPPYPATQVADLFHQISEEQPCPTYAELYGDT